MLPAAAVAAVGCSGEPKGKQAAPDTTEGAITAQPEDGCVYKQRLGHDYWLCPTRRTWADAEQACRAVGTDLVRIDDSGEDSFLAQSAGRDQWIGGSSPNKDGTWTWTIGGDAFWSGTPGAPVNSSYVHWSVGEPNARTTESCAAQAVSGKWESDPCSQTRAYTCESSARSASYPQAPGQACRYLERNGHGYWFCRDASAFDQAQASCKSVGMDLASIDDATENAFIKSNAKTDSLIGLTDKRHEGHWNWSADRRLAWCGTDTGRLGDNGEYANWAPHEPKGSNCTAATRNGKSYWFCPDGQDFATASSACQSVGMLLAHSNDSGENAFLAQRCGAMPFSWIGASRSSANGAWVWQDDGSSLLLPGVKPPPSGYQNWASGYPSSLAGADCLALQPGGGWANRKCSDRDAWICEGAAANPELPDPNDCSLFNAQTGTWSAVQCNVSAGFVCETADAGAATPLDAVSQFIRDDYRSLAPRVSQVTLQAGVTLAHPFASYAERLGLRECVDSLEASGSPTTAPGQTFLTQTYEQTYLGTPVYTRGYALRTDATTHQTLSFEGRFEPGIDTSTTATVTESTALGKAAAAIGRKVTDYRPTPSGRLVIFPAAQGPHPNWQLAWLFALPPVMHQQGYTVAVSALSAKVLQLAGTLQSQCSSVDVTATPPTDPAPLTVNSFQQSVYYDPDDTLGMKLPGTPASPYVLYSKGVSLDPSSPLATSPTLYLQCGGDTFPKVATLGSSSVDATKGQPDTNLGAAFYMSAQRCLEFFAKDFEYAPGQPWIGYDGQGIMPISLQLHAGTPTTDPQLFYNPVDSKVHFYPSGSRFFGAAIEIFCHELGHGLWQGLLQKIPTNVDLETKTLNEGFADIVGSAAEMVARNYDEAAGWCFDGDSSIEQNCVHDLKNPEDSSEPGCRVLDSAASNANLIYSECPRDYRGPDYCTLGTQCTSSDRTPSGLAFVNCCTEHRNSTVLSHAFYLMAKGGDQTNSSSCAVTVQPLDADLGVSVRKAADLLFRGLRSQLSGPPTGYEGLADATLTAARDLYGVDSNEARTVAETWYAVNVKEEDFFEADAPNVWPAREATNVYPWMNFSWPALGDEKSWDLQIATGSFDTALVYDGSDLGTPWSRNGVPIGQFQLSLPFDSTTRYFWRVRPHATGKWLNCFPINSFVGTSHPDDVTNVHVIRDLTDDGKVKPGVVEIGFRKAGGAALHRVYISTKNPHCKKGSNVLFAEGTGDHGQFTGPTGSLTLDSLQPEEHYFLNVQPIGPGDFNGNESPGNCYETEFDTVGLEPPVLGSPADGKSFEYDQPHAPSHPVFFWTAAGQPAVTHLEFFEVTENGDCEPTPVHVEDATAAPLDALLFPVPNGTGYCWDAYTSGSNKIDSPRSDMRHFYYYRTQMTGLSPAASQGAMEQRLSAGLVGGRNGEDTWNQPVTVQWDPDPFALDYHLKLGSWRWDVPRATPYPTGETEDPRQTFFEDLVQGPTYPFTADQAGHGRYCWEVWPRFDDPENPGHELIRAPTPLTPFRRCYTTGPAPPELVFDNLPDDGVYRGLDPITGHVHLPYVPDAQATLDHSSSTPDADAAFHWNLNCPGSDLDLYFQDVIDCTIDFSIDPVESGDWTVHVQTFNSDAEPPVLDDASRVHDISQTVSEDTCGSEDERCCNRECRTTDLVCTEGGTFGKCVQCGNTHGLCCDVSPHCKASTNVCTFISQGSERQKCEPCGTIGTYCCDPNEDGSVKKCEPNSVCVYNGSSGTLDECVHCGGSKEPCCTSGTVCQSGLTCAERDGHANRPDCYADAPSCPQPTLPAPTLPITMTDYQQFCTQTSGCFIQDQGLCAPNCDLNLAVFDDLFNQGLVECEPTLEFFFGAVSGAKSYNVYIREIGSIGGQDMRNVNQTFFSNTSVHSPAGQEPRVFAVAVRPVDTCGNLGNAISGMIAVRDDCVAH